MADLKAGQTAEVQARDRVFVLLLFTYAFTQDGNDDEKSAQLSMLSLSGGGVTGEIESDIATGVGTREEGAGVDNLSDDMSDTGWDTDLEVEGVWTKNSFTRA